MKCVFICFIGAFFAIKLRMEMLMNVKFFLDIKQTKTKSSIKTLKKNSLNLCFYKKA